MITAEEAFKQTKPMADTNKLTFDQKLEKECVKWRPIIEEGIKQRIEEGKFFYTVCFEAPEFKGLTYPACNKLAEELKVLGFIIERDYQIYDSLMSISWFDSPEEAKEEEAKEEEVKEEVPISETEIIKLIKEKI